MSLKMLALVAMLSLLVQSHVSNATNYTVGDAPGGWKYGVAGWENGKNFKVGDTLVFNYYRWDHDVVIVDKEAYDSCITPPYDIHRTFQSGNDQITLVKGYNYFICIFPDHCKNGMKIAAYAA